MGHSVAFDYDQWIAAFPALATVLEAQANAAWDLAGLIWPNDGTGPANTEAEQRALMGYLTAHVVQIDRTSSTGGMTGRVTSASQGSVSASVESFGPMNLSRAWLSQTPYGQAFLVATMKYRGARWYGAPRRSFEPAGVTWRP